MGERLEPKLDEPSGGTLELGDDPRARRSRSLAPHRYAPLPSSVRVDAPDEGTFFERMKFYVGMTFVVALLVGGVGWLFGPKIVRRLSAHGRAAAAIEPHVNGIALEEYGPAQAIPPYLVGKVVAIDDVRREIDPVFYELPEGLYAKNAGEIATVVLVSCGNRILGEYRAPGAATGTFKAYAINCRVQVLDRNAHVRMQTNFESKDTPPPTQQTLDGNWYAQRPTKDIASWLLGLPRR